MQRFILLSAVLMLSAGCGASLRFSAPPSGIQRSGEPLAVREVTTAKHTTERQEVGKVNYTDSSGRSYGSATVYQDVPVTRYVTNWYLFQGEDRVDDADFYKIAGEAPAAAEAASYRSSGVIFNWLGLGLTATGLLSTVGVAKATDNHPVSYLCLSGAIVGGVLWWIGQRRLAPENHAFDSVTAINTANAYNRRLASATVDPSPPLPPPPPPPPPPPAAGPRRGGKLTDGVRSPGVSQ